MTNKSRFGLLVSLIALLGVFLAGCSDPATDAEKEAAKNASKQVIPAADAPPPKKGPAPPPP
jgi:PBP1b-binding outer membrane lipoprotein LpoB